MEDLDFSVIVCCYNSNLEKLKKTITSVVNQKDVKFEIIVSDDGSKNREVEQIKLWAEQNKITNIKYNFLKENVGTVKNILSAAKLCTANYIQAISPGDYFFDEFTLKKYLLKFKKNYKLLFSKAVYYTSNGKILKNYNPHATGTKHMLFMKKNLCQFFDCFLGATMAWHKDMFKYLESLSGVVKLLEDYPLTFLALMNNEKVGFINDNLVWYECDTGVSTTNGGSLIESDYENFFNYLLKENKNNKKLIKTIKILRLLKRPKTFKNVFKIILLKPSYMFYIIDSKITKLCRKIKYSLIKTDISKMNEITTLQKLN